MLLLDFKKKSEREDKSNQNLFRFLLHALKKPNGLKFRYSENANIFLNPLLSVDVTTLAFQKEIGDFFFKFLGLLTISEL